MTELAKQDEQSHDWHLYDQPHDWEVSGGWGVVFGLSKCKKCRLIATKERMGSMCEVNDE